jgi:hypothetical protein
MPSKQLLAAAAAIVVLILIGGAVIYATIPDAGGVIHGCYKADIGLLRVIDNAVTGSLPNETQLNWNQTGPQGAPGPQGATGPQGPAGPQGIPGDNNVLTEGISVDLGASASKSLTVPGFGSVDVSCNTSGTPAVILTTAVGAYGIYTPNLTGVVTPTFDLSQFGPRNTVWLSVAGGFFFKVDFIESQAFELFRRPCVAAVTVTTI